MLRWVILSGMIFRKKTDKAPWELEPSIYSVIETNLKFGSVEDIELPDEERFADDSNVLWAPGALDGIFIYHVNHQRDDSLAENVLHKLLSITKRNLLKDKLNLYNLLRENHVLPFLDSLLEKISDSDMDLEDLYNIALWLATETPDREPVKLGIGLLGRLDAGENSEHVDIIRLLGQHNEFTLYSAIALSNRVNTPLDELLILAKQVHGWGKIHVVERICEQKPLASDVQEWLIREGFMNTISDQYLAGRCASAGNLKDRLCNSELDKDFLNSVGQLIMALLQESSALPDIDDYDDSSFILQKYLELIKDKELTDQGIDLFTYMKNFLSTEKAADDHKNAQKSTHVETETVSTKERILTSYIVETKDPEEKWKERYKKGWTPEMRSQLLKIVEAKLGKL
jgi:hypothetical protein